LNPAAFTRPPEGQTRNFPVNGLRGEFSINQTDLALRRRFNLTERIELDLWEEYFNVFNHPMFGAPGSGDLHLPFGGMAAPRIHFSV
jgi:hypothetical protein